MSLSSRKGTALFLGSVLWALSLGGCLTENQDRQDNLSALSRWEDQRLAPQDSLTNMLRHTDAHVRLAAVRTAGLIGRSDVLPDVIAALDDASGTVVRQAAFSLGLLGDPDAVEALEKVARDPHTATRIAALRGLAHLQHGGKALLDASSSKDPDEAAAAWDGLRNQVAKVDSTALSAAIEAGLARQETDVLWRVIRCAERAAWPEFLSAVAQHAHSTNPQVRVHAYRCLSQYDTPEALMALIQGGQNQVFFKDRHQQRVDIALLRGIGNLAHHNFSLKEGQDQSGRDFLVTTLITGAGHAHPHVAVTALLAMKSTVASLPLPPQAARQESLLPVWRIRLARAAQNHLNHAVPDVKAAAINARVHLRGEGAISEVQAILDSSPTPRTTVACLQSISQISSAPWNTLFPFASPDGGYSPPIRVAALEGLVQTLNRENVAGPRERVLDQLTAAAADPDFVVASTGATLLGQFPERLSLMALVELWDSAGGPEKSDMKLAVLGAIKEMGPALLTLSPPDNTFHPGDHLLDITRRLLGESFDSVDIRIRLAGKSAAEVTGLLPSELIPTTGSLMATLPRYQRSSQQAGLTLPFKASRVKCTTPKGDVIITLDGKNAPNTCANFLQLVEDGYFEDLNFHRVVPDFVVQGGCPRGDGWGGPGHNIRSEWSRLEYKRGAVGIAHSGKDTGGSQFFFTLSEQPHLNGRYTVFGEVTKGMDIVDQLTVGDTFKMEIIP